MSQLSELFSVWITTRAGGLTSYLLLFVSTAAGLLMSGKLSGRKSQAAILAVHQWAGWFGFLFGLMHGMVLLFDRYVGYSAVELAVPFASDDHRWLNGIGTLSLYISAILIASSDLMKRLGRRLWRAIHFLAFAGYGMALAHGILLGTDTRNAGIAAMYATTGLIVVGLLVYRIYSAMRKPQASPSHSKGGKAERPPRDYGDGRTVAIEYIPPAETNRIRLDK